MILLFMRPMFTVTVHGRVFTMCNPEIAALVQVTLAAMGNPMASHDFTAPTWNTKQAATAIWVIFIYKAILLILIRKTASWSFFLPT